MAVIALVSMFISCRQGCRAQRELAERQVDELIIALTAHPTAGVLLRNFKIDSGPSIRVRARRGSIPETSGGGGEHALHVGLYSTNCKSALLLSVADDESAQLRMVGAYLLERRQGSWVVAEGNGGPATFAAIARYVSDLEDDPRQDLQLP